MRGQLGEIVRRCVTGMAICAALACVALDMIARASDTAALAGKLHVKRTSASDLEVAGDVPGVPRGETRYARREDLLAISRSMAVTANDGAFTVPSNVKAVPLGDLARALGAPAADMVVAICTDKYRANYPREYIEAHHPLLVLELNGKPLEDWPKDTEGTDRGWYLIAHVSFTPAFKILSHEDEPQIPWGVVRLEFRDEKSVFGAIEPRGPFANKAAVQAGYRIAQQNCFRCHNAGDEGGQKSGVTWAVLSAIAVASPDFFAEYVRNPKSKSPRAQMPGDPEYDDKSLQALTAYFRSFSQPGNL